MTVLESGVTAEVSGQVGKITFANPPLNFATTDMLKEIADAIEAMDKDPQVRCLLLQSIGKQFCAGADLQHGDANAEGDAGVSAIDRMYAQAARLFQRRKPMIAAIQGAAVGAGLGLALSADFRIAAPEARFSANFVRLGFYPGFGLTCTLPRLVGQQRASWMMLSAERVKPQDALVWGLVDRLVEAGSLAASAEAMANEVAENAPLSLLAVRNTFAGQLGDEVKAAMKRELANQAELRETHDYAEGVASVFERRAANFIGK
jgi:enoyl-CoA hydratase/carnithine racemase